MSVGSATSGNSNAGNVGSNSNTNAANESNSVSNKSSNNSTVDSNLSVDKAVETSKPNNESIETTYASRTGISTAVARARVENAEFSATVQAKVDDRDFDGHFVGKDGQTYPPDTPLTDIDAVTPTNGVTNDRTIVHVNGINTDVAGQQTSLQAIADQTGSRVIGIHNSTGGMVRDLGQSLGDKLDIGNNAAVDTLADTIYNELIAGREVDLMAHSQGAIISSRALTDVRNRLELEDGMSRQQAEALLGNVRAETFGGASRRFPDGPQYVHYVNRNDLVPMAFGLRDFLNPFAHEGRGAVTHYFREGNSPHSFNSTYLNERVPFDQARQGIFN